MLEEKNERYSPMPTCCTTGRSRRRRATWCRRSYVDLSGALPLDGLSLVKASEPPFDLRTAATIRLSRPSVFRSTGEVLVRDEREGRARTSMRVTVEGAVAEQAEPGQAHASPWCESRARTHQDDVQGDRAEDADKRRSVCSHVRQRLPDLLHLGPVSEPKRAEAAHGWSRAEVDHVMACGRSLEMAVELLDGVERERAAAWYAFQFIVDLVGVFGPIVKSVCMIRECIAVVELKPAPLSGAEAWATFSGTGTYSLWVDCGKVQELVSPGRISRRGRMSQSAVVETLRTSGWGMRDR